MKEHAHCRYLFEYLACSTIAMRPLLEAQRSILGEGRLPFSARGPSGRDRFAARQSSRCVGGASSESRPRSAARYH